MLPSMKGNRNWAIAAGNSGVFSTPGPGNAAAALPDVDIGADLPDGSEVSPTLQTTAGGSGAGGYIFDPPLPEGSVIYLDGGVLLTVGPPRR